MGARLLRAAGSPGQEAPTGGAGVSLQMDSHNLSLLEGARGLRRERLPGSFGQAQLAAGGSNQGGVVRNMCETCGAGSEFFLGKINFLLDSTPQKSASLLNVRETSTESPNSCVWYSRMLSSVVSRSSSASVKNARSNS